MSETSRLWDKAAKCRRALARTSDMEARVDLVRTIKELEHRADQSLAGDCAALPPTEREFHVGQAGDQWVIDVSNANQLRIVHRHAAAKGGTETHMSLPTFLDAHTPQSLLHQALMHLLSAMLLESFAAHGKQP